MANIRDETSGFRRPYLHMNYSFETPVAISLDTDASVRNIKNARDALHVLTHYWPKPGTPEHFDAHRTCLEAISGVTPPEIARDAFVSAARGASVLIEDE